MLGPRSVVCVAIAACAALCACAGNQAEPEASGDGAGMGASAGSAGSGATAGSTAAGTAAGKGGASAAAAGTGGGGAGGGGAGSAGSAAAGGEGGSRGGAAGSTGTTSHGGLPPPDPSVSFEWPATLPGGDDGCRPGHYDGTFSCEYRMVATDVDPLVIVDGPISLTLERSQDGEFLEITDGQLEGVAQLVIGFRSKLSGKLDCATGRLMADAVDGVYGFGDPSVLPFGAFAGTLTGTLDTSTGTLDGQWSLGVDGGGACVGPWQANWAP